MYQTNLNAVLNTGVLMKLIIIVAFFTSLSSRAEVSNGSHVMGLNDLIKLATQSSETVQSTEKTVQAIEAEIQGRDSLLSPKLDAELAKLRDNRDTLTEDQKFRSYLFTTSLSKLFSTGTTLNLTVGNTETTTNATESRNTGTWELRLTQSLWRDAFGLSTSLRHEAEKNELQSRTLTSIYQRQSFLVDLEGAYWDLVQALRELEIRKTNIERSQTVATWTQQRVSRATAEKSDLYQAQALVSSRQLDLISVQSKIVTLQNKLRQLVPNVDPAAWNINVQELGVDRQPEALLSGATGSEIPVRLDSLSAQFKAKQASAEAQNTDQALRPKLDAYVAYGEAGVDPKFSTSWDRARDPIYSETRVGILFSMDLDSGVKNAQRQASRLNAQARELEAIAQSRTSNIGWADLSRQLSDLRRQRDEATRLAEFNEKKVNEERNRYRLGRTTVFQLITFEIDAANSKIALSQILTNLRKIESQARIFTRQVGGLR
jgi:HAE1 family hydrophobic/amphiphilic exporter-1